MIRNTVTENVLGNNAKCSSCMVFMISSQLYICIGFIVDKLMNSYHDLHVLCTCVLLSNVHLCRKKRDLEKKHGQLHQNKMIWHTAPILLMEKILHQLIGSSSHYLQGFSDPKWFLQGFLRSTVVLVVR